MRSLANAQRLTAEANVGAARAELEDLARRRRKSLATNEDVLVAVDRFGAALEQLDAAPKAAPAVVQKLGAVAYRCIRLSPGGAVDIRRTGRAHWRTAVGGEPREVAHLILLDVFGPEGARHLEFNFSQDFKDRLALDGWAITQDEIRRWADAQQQ